MKHLDSSKQTAARAAVFVKFVQPARQVERAIEVQSKIEKKLDKLQLPQGPAFINGRGG